MSRPRRGGVDRGGAVSRQRAGRPRLRRGGLADLRTAQARPAGHRPGGRPDPGRAEPGSAGTGPAHRPGRGAGIPGPRHRLRPRRKPDIRAGTKPCRELGQQRLQRGRLGRGGAVRATGRADSAECLPAGASGTGAAGGRASASDPAHADGGAAGAACASAATDRNGGDELDRPVCLKIAYGAAKNTSALPPAPFTAGAVSSQSAGRRFPDCRLPGPAAVGRGACGGADCPRAGGEAVEEDRGDGVGQLPGGVPGVRVLAAPRQPDRIADQPVE
jgi:hypothetical protein